MLFTAPILEDDYYRYLWDGAVTANALNPYAYSPQQVLKGTDIPVELTQLAEESGEVIHSINHPEIRTIYPPIAQAFFRAILLDGFVEFNFLETDTDSIRSRYTITDFQCPRNIKTPKLISYNILVEPPALKRDIQFRPLRCTGISFRFKRINYGFTK